LRYLVRLANQHGASPEDKRQLSKSAYAIVQVYGADVGNLRVSSSAIELDLLLTSEDQLQPSLKALEDGVGRMLTIRKLDVPVATVSKPEAIKSGVALFNEERYWESHEALESAWKMSEGDEKEILQGLILVAAAMVHWQKNERQVTLAVLKRAREKLAGKGVGYAGVNLLALTSILNRILESEEPLFVRFE